MNNLGILLAILFVASAQTESNPTIVNGKIFFISSVWKVHEFTEIFPSKIIRQMKGDTHCIKFSVFSKHKQKLERWLVGLEFTRENNQNKWFCIF